MKAFLVTLVGASLLAACSLNKPQENNLTKETHLTKETQVPITETKAAVEESVVISDPTALASYTEVMIEPLDLSSVVIRQPASMSMINSKPWALNDQDHRYYQEKYLQAMQKQWLDKSGLKQVNQASATTLKVKGSLLEIAPSASKDEIGSRPVMSRVYSDGLGYMTLKIEVLDAISGKSLAVISDRRELGNDWEENNRVIFNQKVRLAFDAWARNLQKELM